MLILDFDRLGLPFKSSPVGDEINELEMGLSPLVPNSFLFRHADGHAVVLLKHESAPALEMTVPPQLTDIPRAGVQVRWRRPRSGRQAGRNTRRPKPRPVELSAVLLQEVNEPSASRLASPYETCAAEFEEFALRRRPRTPYYPIDTVQMIFEPGRKEMRFRKVATDERARLLTFQGKLPLTFIKDDPLERS